MRSPVFRHAGSWRHAGRAWWYPTQIAPRRWCEAVAATMALRATCCVSRGWLVGSCGVMTACHRLRGGILGAPIGGPRMSPTPRSAKYGATHGCNPSRGSKNVRLRSSSPSLRRLRPVVGGEVLCSQSRCADAAPDGKPRSGVPDRNPALTQLCRGLGNGSHDCVPKVRPCSARVC